MVVIEREGGARSVGSDRGGESVDGVGSSVDFEGHEGRETHVVGGLLTERRDEKASKRVSFELDGSLFS